MKITDKISKHILKNPIPILLVILVFTIFFGYFAFFSSHKLRVDFSLEQMFPENDEDRDLYQGFIDEFSREDDIAIYIYETDSIFSLKSLLEVADITSEIELIDGVESVKSLANLNNGKLLDGNINSQEWVQSHPIYKNGFLSKDSKLASIIINLSDEINNHETRNRTITDIELILNQYKNYIWHGSGIPVMRTNYVHFVNNERSIFLPIAFIVVAFVLFFLFRQLKGVLLPLIAISVTLIWISALMAYLNISINIMSYLVFNLLMVIGVSDAIHILIKYHENLNNKLNKEESLIEVIKEIGSALFLTSFTTAIGFFSLMFTNIKITREFGLMLGIGVFLLFILTIIIIPAILSLINIPDKKHISRLISGGRFQAAASLNKWNEKHPKKILIISILFLLITLGGLLKMDYDSTITDDLKPGNKLYDDMKYVEQNFGGTLPLEIVLDFKGENNTLKYNNLVNMKKFKLELEKIKDIGSIVTYADYLEVINEEIGSGIRTLPENIEECLSLIYTLDEPIYLLNSDYSKGRISARLANISTSRGKSIKEQIEILSKNIFDGNVEILVTGSTLLALKTNQHLVKNLTLSFLIAFIIIFLSIVFLFKSKKLAILSILPNVLPLMVAGAIMGYLDIKLRPSTAMTFSIALGIAVDDTIHFLSRFRKEFKIYKNHSIAIKKTLLTTGKAIINTTIILGLGFVVFIFSEFVPNHEFGILATIILIVALAGSMILLPVLINYTKPKIKFNSSYE